MAQVDNLKCQFVLFFSHKLHELTPMVVKYSCTFVKFVDKNHIFALFF